MPIHASARASSFSPLASTPGCPFEHIASVQMLPPKRLRDMLWAPAIVRPSETFRGMEMGEVIVPAIAPLTWRHADGPVRLGRVTEWESSTTTRKRRSARSCSSSTARSFQFSNCAS